MAVLNQLIIGSISHLVLDTNPTNGQDAPVGSIALFNNAGNALVYQKIGSLNTDWSQIISGQAFNTSEKLTRAITVADALAPYDSPPAGGVYQTFSYFIFDKADYSIPGSVLELELEGIFSSSSNNNAGNFRLSVNGLFFGTTAVSTGTTNPSIVTSQKISTTSWPTGKNIVELQVNRTSSGTVALQSAVLRIFNTF